MNIHNYKLLFIFIFLCPLISFSKSDTLVIGTSFELNSLMTRKFLPAVIVLKDGRYSLNRSLVFNNNVELIGESKDNVIIVGNKELKYFIRSNNKLSISNIIIDGVNLVQYGIIAYDDISINFCTIKNLRGDKKMSGIGIRTNISNKKVVISNSIFANISGFEDGIEGNSIGANRGLFLKGGDINIKKCEFLDILGNEDSDAIHIQDENNQFSNTVISNCVFKNFGKRAIKTSVSNNNISNNNFENIKNSCYVVVGLIGCSNNFIDSNIFNVSTELALISISNSIGNQVKNNIVHLKLQKESSSVFYIKNVEDLNIVDNTFNLLGEKSKNLIRNRNQKRDNLKINFSNDLNKIIHIN